MGLFSKLKDALFEEYEEEVEEKPVKPKKEKPFVKKESLKDKLKRKDEDKPIAQKVVLNEKMVDERTSSSNVKDEDFDVKDDNLVLDRPISDTGSFKVVEDQDLIVEEYDDSSEPEIIDIIPRKEDRKEKKEEVVNEKEETTKEENTTEDSLYNYYEEPKYESNAYNDTNKRNLYNMDNRDIRVHEYGSVNKRESTFKPSPIISPIYGILDKNYKKEDIVSRNTGERSGLSFERHSVTVDDVRRKAYGTLTDELVDDMDKELEVVEDLKPAAQEDETLLVDLSNDDVKPEVKEITVGDAVEYYDDLGLEYNVDYKDASLEKKRREILEDVKHEPEELSEPVKKKEKEEVKEEKKIEEKKEEKVEEKVEDAIPEEEITEETVKEEKNVEEVDENDIIGANFKNENEVDDESDDNLFDLIDSMYQEKEG